MLIGSYTKQASMVVRRTIDYTCRLDNGQTITAVTGSLSHLGTTALLDVYIMPDAKQLEYFFSGGVDKEEFKITFHVSLSDGQIMEDEVEFYIEEH